MKLIIVPVFYNNDGLPVKERRRIIVRHHLPNHRHRVVKWDPIRDVHVVDGPIINRRKISEVAARVQVEGGPPWHSLLRGLGRGVGCWAFFVVGRFGIGEAQAHDVALEEGGGLRAFGGSTLS